MNGSNVVWQSIVESLCRDFADFGDLALLTSIVVRLVAAGVLGGIVGYEREIHGKSAGLRTHMLVASGAALFVLSPQQGTLNPAELGRIIQGIAAGVGFIGAGAILKHSSQGHIKGLTTAAGIWLTAAIGVAAGVGRIGLAITATLLGMIVLLVLGRYERALTPREHLAEAEFDRRSEATANKVDHST